MKLSGYNTLWPIIISIVLGPAVHAQNGVLFEDTGRSAFLQGDLGNAGQNLYVAADGSLRTIHWFDFNRDGYPDILAVNDQNPYENVDLFIYPNHPREGLRSLLEERAEDAAGFQSMRWLRQRLQEVTMLPLLGGGRSAVADLNGDGYPDLIIPNFIHGWAKKHFPVFVYWGGADGYSLQNRSEFPSLAAKAVAVVDLNQNGRLDLVMANYGMEYHANDDFFGDQYTSWVYQQGERGFSEENRLEFPTEYAVDVTSGIIGEDTYPSLVFLHAGPRPAVRIFRGGNDGVSPENYQDIPVLNVRFGSGVSNRILLQDLNGDGLLDLFVPSFGEHSEIFWQGEHGFSSDNRTMLTVDNALAAAAEDLDGDGFVDLVVASYSRPLEKGVDHVTESTVFWGSATGYSDSRVTRLPTMGATAVALGDLDGDGRVDIVFANGRNSESYDVPSWIYWGGQEGYSPYRRSALTAFGPIDVHLHDFSGDGRLDVLFVNRQSGGTHSSIMPSYVFWGNDIGHYSTASMTVLPVEAGYSASAADLTNNGYADIIFTTRGSVSIAYADEDGHYHADAIETIEMPFRGFSTSVADLNKDGHLDVVVGGIHREGGSLAILYGKEGGKFHPIELFHADMDVIATAIADMDGDGSLDLLLGGRRDILIVPVLQSGRPALDEAQRIDIPKQTQRLTVADLNQDGALDIVAAHYRDFETKRLGTNSTIYWNDGGSFASDHSQDFPTSGGHWVSVVDLDRSGQPDLIFSNYHGEQNRMLDLFIYPADTGGNFDSQRRMTVPAASSSAHYVVDTGKKGWKDLVVFNHTGPNQYLGMDPMSGIHGFGSWFYHGGEGGYSRDRRETLPTFGPHRTLNAEPGDIARRKSFETYTSALRKINLNAGKYILRVSGDFHPGSLVRAAVRSGSDQQWEFLQPSMEQHSQERTFEFTTEAPLNGFQYQLYLDHGSSGTAPIVTSVRLEN